MKLRKEKGFTLAELLIVVAIIAVLVAVAIPVFSAQLEKSREAVDTANIRSAISRVATMGIFGGSAYEEMDAGTLIEDNVYYESNYGINTFTAVVNLEQKTDGWSDGQAPEFGGNVKIDGTPVGQGVCYIDYLLSDAKDSTGYKAGDIIVSLGG